MKSFASLIKPDWPTFATAAALVIIGIAAVRTLTSKPPPQQPKPQPVVSTRPPTKATIEALGPSAYDEGPRRPPDALALMPDAVTTPPPRPPPADASKLANLAIQQLDYETFKKMQKQEIEMIRKRIHEHGPGPDGVTEADLDRMLKNDQIPQ